MFINANRVFNVKALTPKELLAEKRAARKKQKIKLSEAQRKEQNLDYAHHSSPVREYLYGCLYCNKIVLSGPFNNYILVCIIIAGILVGVQTYPGMDTDVIILYMDLIILYSFATEVILKILSEGVAPYRYFTGPEWTWNWFDFCIVIFSLPFIPFAAGQVKLLRLVRLMRLAKVFRKIPRLQMIVMGLIGGLKSIIYIVLLMFLVFYLYAIVGVIFFRDYDSWHFHSIEISMLTLLKTATLDAWGDVFYLNFFGCDVYDAGVFTVDPYEASNKLGGVMWCQTKGGQPALTAIYFVSFVFIASFCMLSLFIGAVSLSMAESMITMRREKEAQKILREKAKMDIVALQYADSANLNRHMQRNTALLSKVFQGLDIEDERIVVKSNSLKAQYLRLAYLCQDLDGNSDFKNFVTMIILLAGVTVGMQTDEVLNKALENQLYIIGQIIQAVFTFECGVKIISEELKPWRYFYDNWNIFDFVVVMVSFVPTGSGSTVTILRLLRLLRVLKLMRALPQLQVIVSALLSGMSSIGFISIILFLFFYFCGIIGLTFFGNNDPWHFGSLHMSMLTLFQGATLDSWSNVMYISLYGCEQQPGDYPELCTHSQSQFELAAIFWTLFILIAALVLLTLFIGVVSMGMEESKREQKLQTKIDAKADKIAEFERLSSQTLSLYKEIFEIVNVTNSTKIGREEIKFGLRISGIVMNDDEFEETWSRVDRDGSNSIDFSEFLEFVMDLKSQVTGANSEVLGRNGQIIARRQFAIFGSSTRSDGSRLNSADFELQNVEGSEDALNDFGSFHNRKSATSISIDVIPEVANNLLEMSPRNGTISKSNIKSTTTTANEPSTDLGIDASSPSTTASIPKTSENIALQNIYYPAAAGGSQLFPFSQFSSKNSTSSPLSYPTNFPPGFNPYAVPVPIPVDQYGFIAGYPFPIPMNVQLQANNKKFPLAKRVLSNTASKPDPNSETLTLFDQDQDHEHDSIDVNIHKDQDERKEDSSMSYPMGMFPFNFFGGPYQNNTKVHPYGPSSMASSSTPSRVSTPWHPGSNANQDQDQNQDELDFEVSANTLLKPISMNNNNNNNGMMLPPQFATPPYFPYMGFGGSPMPMMGLGFGNMSQQQQSLSSQSQTPIIDGSPMSQADSLRSSKTKRKPCKSKVMSI